MCFVLICRNNKCTNTNSTFTLERRKEKYKCHNVLEKVVSKLHLSIREQLRAKFWWDKIGGRCHLCIWDFIRVWVLLTQFATKGKKIKKDEVEKAQVTAHWYQCNHFNLDPNTYCFLRLVSIIYGIRLRFKPNLRSIFGFDYNSCGLFVDGWAFWRVFFLLVCHFLNEPTVM